VTPPLFLVSDCFAVGDLVTLDGPEGHHAADVMRLVAGETVLLTDGMGRKMHGTVHAARKGELDVDVTGVVDVPAPSPRLVVVQALAKGGRDEDAVEAMTEVGVDEFIGWQSARSIAKWSDRTQAKWNSTVRTAAKQARRAWWPIAGGPATTAEVAARIRFADLAVVLDETADQHFGEVELPAGGEVILVVGPEGGISDEEHAAFAEAGAVRAVLGRTVLRSSTAGVVASTLVLARSRWAAQ
jgi:16S rRNA (uracil1498-N3)-methyltransferase